jgi:hypothetical protein
LHGLYLLLANINVQKYAVPVKSVDGVSEPIVNKVNQTADENSLSILGALKTARRSQSIELVLIYFHTIFHIAKRGGEYIAND